jgi:hypothetical protein
MQNTPRNLKSLHLIAWYVLIVIVAIMPVIVQMSTEKARINRQITDLWKETIRCELLIEKAHNTRNETENINSLESAAIDELKETTTTLHLLHNRINGKYPDIDSTITYVLLEAERFNP